MLRLGIGTQPSVVPFSASLFYRHFLAAQARAADEARLGPDRAFFCVPQRAGQPSCEAVELAQAAWEAWQCHSMAQHACARLSHAQERPPTLGMPPCSPAQGLGNLHFALARWRPSRGLLRLRICTQPSVVPFWASLFSQHLLAAQARAAVEARLGPDRASFCVPQGAGRPSRKAVELAQAAWGA